jgi:uncharacterized membrane protein SpoIIM required for sporulation
MKRDPFVAARKPRWKRLESLIAALSPGSRQRVSEAELAELPKLYRQACQDLALAQRRMYGRELVGRLNELALRGREQLYRAPSRYLRQWLEFLASGFPRLVREEWRFFWICSVVFLVPLVGVAVMAHERPDLLYSVLDPEALETVEKMYAPSESLSAKRDADSNVAMFAFYIRNNVGIDFQIFASGLVFGVGSILSLLYNGVHFGAIAGHFLAIGYDTQLFPFVVGHSSWELVAMVIAAVAGMRLGSLIVAPGRRSRSRALVEDAPRCLKLLVGAALMTTLAAFIEGFWSAQPLPVSVKYAFGAAMWLLVIVYLAFGGRRRAA